MIRVVKSRNTPPALSRGAILTQQNCADYDKDPGPYRLPARDKESKSFEFDSAIYGHTTVKDVLKADQADKCVFCEALFDANVAGDVEHYRPKGAITSSTGASIRPGYYWLAYDWGNLLYACPDCNQYKKRDHFPLVQEADRAADHHGDIPAERPLLVDPLREDPRRLIRFDGEVPIWTDPKGETTVRLLALDRIKLLRDRRTYLAHVTGYFETVFLLDGDPRPRAVAAVANARKFLAEAIQPSAKFSSAAIDLIASLEAGDTPPP